MGQSTSKPVTQQQQQQETVAKTEATPTKHSDFKPKKYLSRIELVCLEQSFQKLKSTFKDRYECIELKNFLKHLKLPDEIEPAAILLFKSFSYLGSYPECATAGPVPLSLEAFLTAFVVLSGRLDQQEVQHSNLSESLFFQSLSILPTASAVDAATIDEKPKNESLLTTHSEQTTSSKEDLTSQAEKGLETGLSLANLGINFDDLDLDSDTKESEDDAKGPQILCRDLTELFVCLIWLGEADKLDQHNFSEIRELATNIVYNIKSPSSGTHNLSDADSLPCITHKALREWKVNFSPHLFKPIQSLIIQSFTYNANLVSTEGTSRLLMEDQIPSPSQTDILKHLYTTLLSWALPEQILISKQWPRLYSAEQDGFSMNRFESHVFKYPGPTLFIMEVNAKDMRHRKTIKLEGQQDQTKATPKIIGALITEPWKHSKYLWGSNECFLFELDPTYDIFRPVKQHSHRTDNDHYILYHHDVGIGFGPTGSQKTSVQQYQHNQHSDFILRLDNTLQEGTYQNEPYPEHPTFESATRKHEEFCYQLEIENIEVFGLGSEKDREKQAREWKFERQEAARRANLNIRRADGQLDKELLKMAGIIDEDNRQDR